MINSIGFQPYTHHTHKGFFMTKTPYEIRLETLKLAQHQAHEAHRALWDKASAQAGINENTQYLTEVPEFPSSDQVLNEARKFQAFIDNKQGE